VLVGGSASLPGYQDLVEVARGGDGVVYRAWQDGPGRHVAIKVLLLDEPAAVQRFTREVRITMALGRQHPHIVGVLDSGTTAAGQPYLVMEFYELGSLHDQLRASGPLPVQTVVGAGRAVADALSFAHGQGVLHGDVKPQNILVRPTSYVLADFGLARRVLAEHSTPDWFSYRHAAPQVLDGEPPTAADDVYSLGSTLHALLDGRPPFADDDPASDTALAYLRRARTGTPRPLARPDIPAGLAAIVSRCLARSRADRYPDAAAVRDALDSLPAGTRAPPAPIPGPPALPRPAADADQLGGVDLETVPIPGPPALPRPAADADQLGGVDLEPEPAVRGAPASPGAGPVPRQLPADVSGFTGRAAGLRILDGARAGTGPTAPALAVITGTAGVGKTALAVHWAHRIADRFPDGQLFVNLRGYDPGPAADPADVLALFLRSLGVSPDRVPAGLDERAALYRTMLAGRRMLVLLDNAAGAGQVRPLLPAGPDCLVLVTGRGGLGGLVAGQGATRLRLDVLSADEAAVLLHRLLGERTTAEPRAAADIAALCGFLPVALRVAAANLADSPHQTLAGYAESLRSGDRLRLLAVDGDDEAAIRATFDLSYQRLDDAARRLFRLLGLHPGPEIDPRAAAALAGLPVADSRRLLGVLANTQLMQETGPDRFGFHDLLRAYAADRAAAEDPAVQRQAAVTRLLDWYRYAANVAVDLLRPHRAGLRLDLPVPATGALDLADTAAANAFLETELPTLLAATRHAAAHGWDEHAWQLPHVLWPWFEVGGYLDDWLAMGRLAVVCAGRRTDLQAQAESRRGLAAVHRRLGRPDQALEYQRQALDLQRDRGDRRGQAAIRNDIAITQGGVGRLTEAADQLRQALELYRQVGDAHGEAAVLGNLASISQGLGEYPAAREHLGRGLELARRAGDHRTQAAMLGSLGVLHLVLGDHADAAEHARQSVELYRFTHDRLGEARGLAVGGVALQRLGRYADAARAHQQALDLFRQIGDRRGEAEVRSNLATDQRQMGRYTEAVDEYLRALVLIREVGDRGTESEIRNDLGVALRAAHGPADALGQHRRALALAEETSNRYERARAHEGIARATPAGDPEHDRQLRSALALYAELGVPEAGELAAEFDQLAGRGR
jgi:tetratricopeptide (TPR) repeat protein